MRTKTKQIALAIVAIVIAINAFILVTNNSRIDMIKGDINAHTQLLNPISDGDPGNNSGAPAARGNEKQKQYKCDMSTTVTVTVTKVDNKTNKWEAKGSGGFTFSKVINLSANGGYAQDFSNGNTTQTLINTTVNNKNTLCGTECDGANNIECHIYAPCAIYLMEEVKNMLASSANLPSFF